LLVPNDYVFPFLANNFWHGGGTQMKKFGRLSLILVFLLILIPGIAAAQSSEDSYSTDLIVGGGNPASAIDIGDVLVWNDAESLYIRYVITNPSWCLIKTHLHVATSLEDIPQMNGNPLPGQFENKDLHDCVTDFLFTYNLAEKGWSLNDLLYLAAHTAVADTFGNIHTAWAAGFDFPGKNWATYFTYVVEGEIPVMWPEGGTITVAFEDLPITEQYDFDYNDWVVDIDTLLSFWGTSTQRELQNIEFTFRPEARGAGYDHVFNMFLPGGTFRCDGVSTLQIFDGEGNLIHESIEDFAASVDNNFVVIPWTKDALPEDYANLTNTIEGMPYVDPQRTVYLSIAFNELCPFDFSGFDLTNPKNVHGEGLFFDPWLYVVDTEDDIHQSDGRMLTVPVDWLWPEELTPIWLAYPDVTPGDQPIFTELWYQNFNDLVYNAEVGGAISGHVTEQGTGLPIAGIWVDSCYETIQEEEWGTWPGCQGTETDENGYYSIPYLRPGYHRVVIWGDGVFISEFFDNAANYQDANLVEVFSDQTTGYTDFSLLRGGTISGTVYEANHIDTIAGVHVDACSIVDTFCNGTESNELGEYTIAGLLPDKEYQVFIWGQPGWVSEVYKETIWWDQATLVPVGATGIDFTLEPGGSISGFVMDDDGNPLSNIGVDIMDGGFGVCTNENGYYTLMGLPFGTYDVAAGRDFCGPHEYVEEVEFGVEINEITPNVGGIDFNLEVGGSISGRVTDPSGDGVVDIWVGACDKSVSEEEWGSSQLCNGSYTNNNGFYTITRLRPGDYRVVIWGNEMYATEFYDSALSYYEATLVPVTMEDINFVLSTPVPTFSAWTQDDYVEGWGWDEGSSVTLIIDDPNVPGIVYTDTQTVTLAEWNPEDTYVQFNFQGVFDMQPGFTVMMTDIKYIKQHTVTELAISDVNPDTDIISGTAAPESHVYAWINGDFESIVRHEVADSSGNWSADFSVPGDEPGEENTYNIVPGSGGGANQYDEDGDSTNINWWIEEPYEPHPGFLVNLTFNEVQGWEWPEGAVVSMTINSPDPSGTEVFSQTATVEAWGMNPWETSVVFGFPAELNIGTNYHVTLTDGNTIKEHTITGLTVLGVDETAETVFGTADPGAEIFVDAWQGAMRRTEADQNGNWSVDFSVPGTEDWEQDIIDIVPGSGGGVNQYDEDGDSTNINWWIEEP